MLRQIVFASITNNEHNDCILVERGCNAQRGGEIGAGRSAAENSLHSSQHTRQLKRFTIGDVDYFIYVLDMNVRWHDLLSDPLDKIRSSFYDLSGLFVILEDRAVRISADDANTRIFFFEKSTSARNRAAGAETGDEVRDLAFSLSPQFRTGSAVMRFRVCGI